MNPIGYHITLPDRPLPTFDETYLYEYILAGNGLFVRSQRDGLEATIPVFSTKVQGLVEVTPFVRLAEKIPLRAITEILARSRAALPNEILFWIGYEAHTWEVYVPQQANSPARLTPDDPFDPQGANALVDAHSHGAFQATFSPTDDADETGFRLYLCVGRRASEIAARIGIFGHRWDIPAAWVCELPAEITDCGGDL